MFLLAYEDDGNTIPIKAVSTVERAKEIAQERHIESLAWEEDWKHYHAYHKWCGWHENTETAYYIDPVEVEMGTVFVLWYENDYDFTENGPASLHKTVEGAKETANISDTGEIRDLHWEPNDEGSGVHANIDDESRFIISEWPLLP